MGKRSNFERRERDFYPTPPEAVEPLWEHLDAYSVWEPCAGDGALGDSLVMGGCIVCMSDIEPRGANISRVDALTATCPDTSRIIITNPPWSRPLLHAMIEHFSDMRPTWLLFDADWAHTKQAAPYLPRLRKIVAVGRVKWIPDSKHTGKDNCAWHLFDKPSDQPAEFYGRTHSRAVSPLPQRDAGRSVCLGRPARNAGVK